ncbi:DUF3306 domain-containing protein [Halomonas sp. PGE1]|uniref:DUF3306 domain-containing protein n=1 Tax=Halomonas sp. PGE1 TaxID=2730360 RepID=UPI001473C4C7|nr:DUF3306 domain-containing protein [Halomonas sp. PGE1]QJQ99086.1 DUF3306 domain-containing protein [Halomonas sp. PGE1]
MNRLERWSRRKRGLEAEPAASAEAVPPPHEAAAASDEPDAPPPLLDDTLPDPESLPPGSEVSRYLQEGVSQALRRRALRRLWQADHYQVRDGLDDYDGDYSQLEPMTREVAERLRHWSRRVNEALEPEEAIEEAAPDEEPARGADDEAHPPGAPAPDVASDGRDQGGIGHISDSRQD